MKSTSSITTSFILTMKEPLGTYQTCLQGGDESKVIQLPNGDILMSIRNQHHRTDRIFMLSKDNGQTWQSTTRFKGMHDPAVDGAPSLWNGKASPPYSTPSPLGP